MDLHPRLLLASLVLLGLLSHSILAIIPCEGYSPCRYIVRVRPPPNLSIDNNPQNLESWYRSFLPPRLTKSKTQPPFIHTYKEAIFGFAVSLTKDEADYMKQKDGVLMVYQDSSVPLHTTHTPDFLGLRSNGGAWKSLGMGEGTIIGLLDSGIDFAHTSFDDDGMSPPPAKWHGSCKFESVKCNNKLIGARSLIGGQTPDPPTDSIGHGTHVASTAAGRFVKGASVLGSGKGTASGMAPRAHLAMYKVCNEQGCYQSDILAGLEAAITDGVDILSISLGGQSRPFHNDILAIATFSAMRKGIFVSCSAGNSGPLPGSLSNEAPWMLTVGASTIDRQMKAIVKLGDGRLFVGESAYQTSNLDSLPLLLDVDASGDIKGKVVSSEIFQGSLVEYGEDIKRLGGSGIILRGTSDSGCTTFAEAHVLPASYVNYPDGEKIRQYILRSDKPTTSILFNGTSLGSTLAPIVAYFSSRGPSTASPGILKPDIMGPGVNIIAAWPFKVGPTDVDEQGMFNPVSGTSMAAPHLSGIAAVIRSAHPDWSPAAIKSAIMTTAYVVYDNNKPILDEKLNPAGHFTIGAGHVNPSKAANPGLIYDIDEEQYILYLCGLGYSDSQVEIITHQKDACKNGRKMDEAELNYPSIAVRASVGKLVVNRTVTNVGNAESSYTINIDMPEEVKVVVSPPTLEFTGVKEKKTFTVSLGWDFSKTKNAEGSFKWVSGKQVVRSPIVIF